MDQNLSQAKALIDTADAAYQNQIAGLQAQIESDGNAIASLKFQLQAALDRIAADQAVTVFDGLELIPATVAGGSAANSAGNTGVAADAQSVPTDKNAFRQIFPNGAYQDKYWFWQLGADASKKDYLYELRLMLPTTADAAASQALELDIEQRIASAIAGTVTIYNTGFQFDFAAQKTLNVWNRSPLNHGWVSTGIASPRWTPGQWHEVRLKTHRDDANVYYEWVEIDGSKTDLSKFSFPIITAQKSECLNCAIQLDADKAGTAYLAYIDQVGLTVS